MILAATGHRPNKLGGYRTPNFVFDQVIAATTRLLHELSPELVISGMALGFDQWVAELCIDHGIPWDAAVPFHGFESRWPDESKEYFRHLLTQARQVHYVTDTTTYMPALLHRRNRWMVDHATHVLALWNGSEGGTASCVRYAEQRRKPIVRVDLAPEVWEEAQRVYQMSELRRQAREFTRNPPPIHVFRHAEAFPSPVPMPMQVPERPAPPPPLSEEEAARVLGAQMAQAFTESIRSGRPMEELPDSMTRRLTETDRLAAEAVLRDIFYEGRDDGVPGEDRTVVSIVAPVSKREDVEEKDRFQPGRLIDIDD